MSKPPDLPEAEELAPALAWGSAVWLALALLCGGAAGLLVLPHWLPGLDQSLRGATPHAPWYICRASGAVAFILLWASTCSGLIISARIARDFEMTPAVLDLHQHLALTSLVFALVHAAALLVDDYIGFGGLELVFPFSTRRLAPIPMGLGQLALYATLLGALAFYLRRDLGTRIWRGLHLASTAGFLLALVHAACGGSSADTQGMRGVYWMAGGSALLLSFYRLFSSSRQDHQAERTGGPKLGAS